MRGRFPAPFILGKLGGEYALYIFNHGYTDGRGRYGL